MNAFILISYVIYKNSVSHLKKMKHQSQSQLRAVTAEVKFTEVNRRIPKFSFLGVK